MQPKDHHRLRGGENVDWLSENSRPCQAPHLEEFEVEDEITLFDPHRNQVHILNPTAAVVWQLSDGTQGVAEIASQLAELYGLEPAVVEGDVRDILTQFCGARLLKNAANLDGRG